MADPASASHSSRWSEPNLLVDGVVEYDDGSLEGGSTWIRRFGTGLGHAHDFFDGRTLARNDARVDVTHNSPSTFLLGDTLVQKKYLYGIVSGRRGCNIALTGPEAGSTLTHLTTTAVRDGDDFILNGTKSFATGSNANDLNATFVRFDDVPGVKASAPPAGLPRCCNVDRGPLPGLRRSPRPNSSAPP